MSEPQRGTIDEIIEALAYTANQIFVPLYPDLHAESGEPENLATMKYPCAFPLPFEFSSDDWNAKSRDVEAQFRLLYHINIAYIVAPRQGNSMASLMLNS